VASCVWWPCVWSMVLETRTVAFAAAAAAVAIVYWRVNKRRAALLASSADTTEGARMRGPTGCKTLVEPTLSKKFNLEYSIHRLSRLLRTDVELVFRPDLDAAYQSDPRGAAAGVSKEAFLQDHLLAVPTWQPAEHDLSEISFEVNQERKGLLQNFDAWANAVRPRLKQHWSDVSCPMEGNARYGTSTSTIYNELEGLTQLLRYDSIPIGCCGIVLHPKWQRRAYPVTFFTLAPLHVLTAVFTEVEAD